MAKIFYLGGGTHVRGMLRAVVSLDQLESFLLPETLTHVGRDFPETSETAITLLEISHDESTAKWPAGYSRIQATPTDFDDRLRFLPEPTKSREMPVPQARRNGSALIHWLTRDMRTGV